MFLQTSPPLLLNLNLVMLGRCFMGLLVVRMERASVHHCQSRHLVNIKLKWVKDRTLDTVVAKEGSLKPACLLISMISSDSRQCTPIYHLSRQRGQLGLPKDLKISTFLRRYPTLFQESQIRGGGDSSTPWFGLTDEALKIHQKELNILQQNEREVIERLQKLLMLSQDRTLPLQTIEQLKWDMALPYDYQNSLIPRYPQIFSFIRLPDDRIGLKLLCWDDQLAISELQKNSESQGGDHQSLSFPIGFSRGFGLKRKCMEWLEEWQRLPYTCPYADASHLDPRTDVAEKRIVGVFHELLNLTIQKKTERKNVSNLRKPLGLPQKFTKAFERHPGIFYLSHKCATQTVILREAYSRDELLPKYKHPIVEIREKYASMMKEGMLNRSRGLYKKITTSPGTDSITSSRRGDHQFLLHGDGPSSEDEYRYE